MSSEFVSSCDPCSLSPIQRSPPRLCQVPGVRGPEKIRDGDVDGLFVGERGELSGGGVARYLCVDGGGPGRMSGFNWKLKYYRCLTRNNRLYYLHDKSPNKK
jgi:hypothetical protein